MMNVQASPNVITAALYQRQMSTITATLKKYDGTGQSGRTIVFEVVDAALNRLDIGYFEGSNSVITKTTDSSGTVRVNYFGPLSARSRAKGPSTSAPAPPGRARSLSTTPPRSSSSTNRTS